MSELFRLFRLSGRGGTVLEKLFNYLKGYLILELCGESKERFINLCKNKEIEIIHIFSVKGCLYCKIDCRAYKDLRPLIKKTHCYPKIKEKRGIPFLMQEIKERKGLVLGTILFFLILGQCSGRIWHIDVQGGFLHTRQQILQVLKDEMQVYGGVPAGVVDCFQIEKRLRLDYNEIGWISVEKKGCRLYVMLNESVMPKLIKEQEEPCHIIAERDGVVTGLEVLAGVPMVKIGDTVQKGDILISGIIPIVGDYDAFIRNQPVRAEGKVFLETEFEYASGFRLQYEKKRITGEKTGWAFFVFHRKLFSYIPRYSEGKYDIMCIDIVPYVFDDYQAPVLMKKYRCLRYETVQGKMTEAEAKEKAAALWNEFLADWEAQGVQIMTSHVTTEIQKSLCKTTGTVTACGNFISYQKILEEEWAIKDEYNGDNP